MEWLRTEASARSPKQAVGRTSATHRSEKRIHPGTRRHFGRRRPKRRVFQLLLLAQETGRANSTSSWRRLVKPRRRPRVTLGRPAFAHARAKDPGSYRGREPTFTYSQFDAVVGTARCPAASLRSPRQGCQKRWSFLLEHQPLIHPHPDRQNVQKSMIESSLVPFCRR
jgi:hypothetical protein